MDQTRSHRPRLLVRVLQCPPFSSSLAQWDKLSCKSASPYQGACQTSSYSSRPSIIKLKKAWGAGQPVKVICTGVNAESGIKIRSLGNLFKCSVPGYGISLASALRHHEGHLTNFSCHLGVTPAVGSTRSLLISLSHYLVELVTLIEVVLQRTLNDEDIFLSHDYVNRSDHTWFSKPTPAPHSSTRCIG